MKNKALSLTILFEAESLNYGEGIGNVTQLKKMSRYNGQNYTYLSRQALRYNIANQMGIDNSKLTTHKDVIQFDGAQTIEDSVEQDLFGYFITKDKKEKSAKGKQGGNENTYSDKPRKRTACVRLSNAISLEEYNSDTDFLTNLSFLNRYNEIAEKKKGGGNIAHSEINKSYYVYNLVIELDKIGVDVNTDSNLSSEEKAKRVNALLDTILLLSRDIKGRTESLIPKFAVGGFYTRKNSFFSNTIKCYKNNLNVATLKDTISLNDELSQNTMVAMMDGVFANEEKLKKELEIISIRDMFNYLKKEVNNYYE